MLFVNTLLRLNPCFLAASDWPQLAQVSKAYNRLVSVGPLELREKYRSAIFKCLGDQIRARSTDDNYQKRSYVAKKIQSLKFYQLASFVSEYETLKNFRFRYFSSTWAALVEVPLPMYKVFHPGVILISSDFTPGIFWKTLRNYIEMKSFFWKPHLFHNIDPLEAKIWYFHNLLRGAQLFDISVDATTYYAMKAFAAKFRLYPETFQFYMQGKWVHMDQILFCYEKQGDLCHFPVPCTIYPFCQHSMGESPDTEWDSWTEVVTDDCVVDEIHV